MGEHYSFFLFNLCERCWMVVFQEGNALVYSAPVSGTIILGISMEGLVYVTQYWQSTVIMVVLGIIMIVGTERSCATDYLSTLTVG